MDIKLSTCFIAVDDHDKALGFYRTFSAWRCATTSGSRSVLGRRSACRRSPMWTSSLNRPRAPERPGRRQRGDGGTAGQGSAARCGSSGTDDCDSTFERIRAGGGEVLQEPIDQPYGVRDCAFRDPSGNMLRFSQPRRR